MRATATSNDEAVLSKVCVEVAPHGNEPPVWLYPQPTLLVVMVLVELGFPPDSGVEVMTAEVVVFGGVMSEGE